MKTILISIQPQWVEKILNGEKTIEIRKTRPNCELPVKVYIYCSGGRGKKVGVFQRWNGIRLIKRKVSKGWLKDRPEKTTQVLLDYGHTHPIHKDSYELNGKVVAEFILKKVDKLDGADAETEKNTCLTIGELFSYAKGKQIYAWHIEDLIIYDEPKELSEFRLTKAPQSYQYIKE